MQRHQDVRVGRTEKAARGVLRIQHRVRQPDIVQNVVHLARRNDAADGVLDLVAKPGSLLDSRTRLRAHMENKGAVIGCRKEVLSEEWNQQQHQQAAAQEHGDEQLAGTHQSRQH